MSDIVILVSRILMSAVFILYGSLKFMDVTSIISNPGTKRFMERQRRWRPRLAQGEHGASPT